MTDTALDHLAARFARERPHAAASALAGLAPGITATWLADMAPTELAALLIRMTPSDAARHAAALAVGTAAAALDTVDASRAAPILGRMDDPAGQAILAAMPRRGKALSRLLSHDLQTVGAHLDSDVPAFPAHLLAQEALAVIRRRPDANNALVYLLSATGALVGSLPIGRLLAAADTQSLDELGPTPLPVLRTRDSLRSVAAHPGWRRFDSLPALDSDKRFAGALHRRELSEVGGSSTLDPPASGSLSPLLAVGDAWWRGLATVSTALMAPAAPQKRAATEVADER